jgi:hypothetical protein
MPQPKKRPQRRGTALRPPYGYLCRGGPAPLPKSTNPGLFPRDQVFDIRVSGTAQTYQATRVIFLDDNEVAMGRFYFHLRAGDKLMPDEEGIDLPDLSAARREAIEAARELLGEAIKSGRPEVPEAFVIADEDGRELDAVPLAAVLPENLKK